MHNLPCLSRCVWARKRTHHSISDWESGARSADVEHHVRAAARAKPSALLVADLPYRSYESPTMAVASARKLQAAGAEAVKAEGGRAILETLILPTISLTRRRRRGELTSTGAMATRLVLPSGIGLLLAWGLVLAAQRVAPAEGGDMAGLIVPIIMAGELGAWLVLLTLVLLAIRAELGLWFVLLLALLAIGASLSRSSLPLRW